jgi:hypothetical protein
MKTHLKIMFFLGIILLIIIHWFIFSSNEGFNEGNSAYETLRTRLQTDLADYCETADFVRSQLSQMIQAYQAILSSQSGQISSMSKTYGLNKPAELMKEYQTEQKTKTSVASEEESSKEAQNDDSRINIEQIYKDMYACRDFLSKSRPSCQLQIALEKANITGTKLNKPPSNLKYLPCSTFLDLPDWSNDSIPIIALTKIKDDLPERISKETEWFDAVISNLQSSLNKAAEPPGSPPSQDQINEYTKIAKEREGFTTICHAQAAAVKDAEKCSIPDINSEIDRVNAILDNPIVKNAIGKCKAQKTAMLKIQSDLEKAKNGDLFDWQKDPGKSPGFPKFQGGDRSKAIIHSMQQYR